MRIIKRPLFWLSGLPALLTVAFLISASGEKSFEGQLVVVQIADSGPASINWDRPESSRLVLVDVKNADHAPEVLSEGFVSAHSPEVSFDGQRILFSGKKTASDPWSIWELDLGSRNVREIRTGLQDCTDPVYLPNDEIAFSAAVSGGKNQYALYVTDPDGKNVRRITFHPARDGALTLLNDSRLLYVSAGNSTYDAIGAYQAVRYDGTVNELYTRGSGSRLISGKARETNDRRLLFVEGDPADGTLVSVSEARPLHSLRELAPGKKGFSSVYPLDDKRLVVTYRPQAGRPFGLYTLDPATGKLESLGTPAKGYHVFEPVLVAPRKRPLGFMSVMDPEKKSGWLYSLDADHSQLAGTVTVDSSSRSRLIRFIGENGVVGEVPLEQDGSFFVEIPADTPVRLVTIDAQGQIVRGPSSWVWVRPNEQRGCIGCHENRELVPENRVPMAVNKPAVSLLGGDKAHDDYAEADKH